MRGSPTPPAGWCRGIGLLPESRPGFGESGGEPLGHTGDQTLAEQENGVVTGLGVPVVLTLRLVGV